VLRNCNDIMFLELDTTRSCIKEFYESQKVKSINVIIRNINIIINRVGEIIEGEKERESASRHHKQAVTIINCYAALFIPFT